MALFDTYDSDLIWRDYIVDGDSGSGAHPPVKGDIRSWGALVEGVLEGTTPADALEVTGELEIGGSGTLGANLLSVLVDYFLPVGSTIIENTGTNPGTRFPGTTWVADWEGRALVGVGTADGEAWASGDEKGTATHTLTAGQLAAHTHAQQGTFNSGNESVGHVHSFSGTTGGGGAHNHNLGGQSFITTGGGNSSGSPGGFNYGAAGATSTAPDHAHSFSGSTTDRSAAHTHATTIGGATGSAGSGEAHNNIQPSKAEYVWTRTA